MRPVIGGVILGWLLLGTRCAPAFADGGSMRWSEEKGGYRITVFTAPTPFRAGDVDISALVQDASTGDPMTPVKVTVRMTKPGRRALEYPATTEAATNKLFRAAQFELPEPGRWEVQVQVEGLNGLVVLDGEVEAAEPLPRWEEMWPWIGWPALAVALFGIHQVLARRRSRQAGPLFRGRPTPPPRSREYVPFNCSHALQPEYECEEAPDGHGERTGACSMIRGAASSRRSTEAENQQ